MGATGAGKTVMLNAMAGRLKKKGSVRLDGKVLVNGAPMKRKVSEHFSAYVMQVCAARSLVISPSSLRR